MPDAFDSFLQTFANKDLQVLVNEEARRGTAERRFKRPPPEPKSAPKHKAQRAETTQIKVEDASDTEPPSELEAVADQAPSEPEAVANQAPSHPEAVANPPPQQDLQAVMSKLAELSQKVHNQGRGGRNKLYYEILHTFGHQAAAPFWRPPASFAARSTSSGSKAAPAAQPVQPTQYDANFEPGWWATAPPSTPLPKSMPRPPPPPPPHAPSRR
jgi:myosin tail region-interacting protein MTI1